MCKLRDVVIFFAGAEFFHTLSHVLMLYFIEMPIDMGFMEFTTELNYVAIGVNGFITVLLLFWAYRLSK